MYDWLKRVISTNKTLLKRYVLISLVSYLFVLTFLFVLVNYFSLNETLAFFIVYAINYFFLYFIQLRYLFAKKHNILRLFKFIAYILVFYALANLIYNAFLSIQIHYMLSSILTIILLFPIRLMVSKIYVYK
ncbi:hypothetical protein EAX61_11755 [Dokdonia sinensis]|uniref:GtrA-like protein domain-containing protein n=1 Tax=Dokdonia sinensis TaxID=2479847 RepID=A0A3M0FXL1_9FLAO|nr:hypothetical protein EAX61_11755 [Dokdonia sinensis]